ncbi:MAG: serine hydrolase [Gemmatimonadetes bacterium]|nr:serine hydrolase [Gemmatimonadota bacterium]
MRLILLTITAAGPTRANAAGAAQVHDRQHDAVPTRAGAASVQLARAIATADSLISVWVEAERIPGAVLLVTRGGEVVHERAFGHAQLYDHGMRRLENPPPMTRAHLFDLASVTKVMATTFAIMILVDRGQLELDAPVHRYLAEFRGTNKDSVTVRHLLTHTAGLYEWQPIYYHARTSPEAYAYICRLPLAYGVGDARHYSDLGFMLLGHLVERVGGRPLDVFLHENLYGPLRLTTTGFNPRARGLHPFAATSHGNPFERRMVYDSTFGYRYHGDPTAWDGWRPYTLAGEVNDGNAYYAHGGVAGHAGLFSTARDLAVLLDLLLNRGSYAGRVYIGPAVIDSFLTRHRPGQGLGWWLPEDAPGRIFEHTGFTGTYLVGVPEHRLGIVLLTNRQNVGVGPDGRYPDVDPLRRAVRDTILQAIRQE